MEDIQQQIDDISSRLDDNDSSLQEYSDNLDSSINDIQSNIDDLTQTTSDLSDVSGQLTFPLSQDTIDLIKEQFPVGTIPLVSGSATITDARISPTSVILLSVFIAGGTQGFLSYSASAGQAIITSTSATDASTIAYLIVN